MRIAFFGDSLTSGVPGSSYVAMLREQFPDDTLANAAREVARCGIIYNNLVAPNSIEQCIDNSIATWGLGLGLVPSDFQVTFSDDTIRVQLDYNYQPITGLVLGGTLPLRTVVTMQNEY